MIAAFGQLPGGEKVEKVRISGGGLSAAIISWGAVVQDLRLEGHGPPLVLGFHDLDAYVRHSPYFGAIVGRFANRIANATYSIDGRQYQADRNFLGKHTLHGGAKGIGRRNWRFTDAADNWVQLEIFDSDAVSGFPGDCTIRCTYCLTETGSLEIELAASADQATLCNLAHHSYFNLDGSDNILGHELQIDADHYLPVDAELIPTGEVLPVQDTPFDFRTLRTIGGAYFTAYDHNYCLSDKKQRIRQIAIARSPLSEIEMRVSSTEPGVQLYAGKNVSTPVPGLSGHNYGSYAGFCLEPQIWPDAPNHPRFPNSVLYPDETYFQQTRYSFSKY